MANWPRSMPVAYNNKCSHLTFTLQAECRPVIVAGFVIVSITASSNYAVTVITSITNGLTAALYYTRDKSNWQIYN